MPASIGDFEGLVLFAILRLGEEAYGLAIREELETKTGRSVNSGAVYTALNRMERRGLVASRMGAAGEQRAGRRKRYYRVEPVGAEALLSSWEAMREMARGQTARLQALVERSS